MKTFSINTLGCKVNQYEAQQIRQLLERSDLSEVPISQMPDLAIVNTCCVTSTASAKSRQLANKAQRLNPNTTVVICGCLAKVNTGELKISAKNVHLVGPYEDLAAKLDQLITLKNTDIGIKPQINPKIKHKSGLPPLKSFKGHTRAFLKVQDGCDRHCTYCIVPKARPKIQSKPPKLVIAEAQNLIAAGHKEIVLTGIFLGAIGQNSTKPDKWPNKTNPKLASLLTDLAQVPNLHRIRLSSLESADVTDQLLDVFCEFPNIAPHLHLSIQAGSDAILKKMARQYTIADFLEKVDLINARLDRPAITTDIIVGFPGETDSDFQKTISLAKQVSFAKIHVFPFSPRPGTAAAKMQDVVDKKVIKERSQILRDLDIDLQKKFRDQFIGENVKILVEKAGVKTAGRSERYFMVEIDNPTKKLKKNDIVEVKLVENNSDLAIGKIQKK